MVNQALGGPRFRQRKVPVKQQFAIIKEVEFDSNFDDEARNAAPAVITGVDEKEEVVSWPNIMVPSENFREYSRDISRLGNNLTTVG